MRAYEITVQTVKTIFFKTTKEERKRKRDRDCTDRERKRDVKYNEARNRVIPTTIFNAEGDAFYK